jgi:hypothetical protein
MPPFGLRGWQVAFFAVGLPGLALALLVRTLREPVAGEADGIVAAPGRPPAPGVPARARRRAATAHVRPPRHARRRHAAVNLVAAVAIAAGAVALTRALGNPVQWIALGVGVYAAVSWTQALRLRDPVAFALIFRTRSIQLSALAFSFLAFTGYALGFWVPPFFVRVHGGERGPGGAPPRRDAAAAGWLGATAGGVLADRWRARTPSGRLRVAMLTAILPVPLAICDPHDREHDARVPAERPTIALQSTWLGAGASTVQDLVLPRMRATASAAYLFLLTFVGLALGPYTVGRLSVALGDLRAAMLLALSANVLAFVFAALAARHVARGPGVAHDARTRGRRASRRLSPRGDQEEDGRARHDGAGAQRPRHVHEPDPMQPRRQRDGPQQVVGTEERPRLAVDLDAPAGKMEVGEHEERRLRRARLDLDLLLRRDDDPGCHGNGDRLAAQVRHGAGDDGLAARIEAGSCTAASALAASATVRQRGTIHVRGSAPALS